MTDTTESFGMSLEAAEAYESSFVPALFAEWAPHLVDAADVGSGDHVLDVACGTGIVARTAATRVGPTGTVTGTDLNPAMVTVARRVSPDLDFRVADAASLPFDDSAFDAVLCQMALMFFPDRVGALREMARVTAPDGVVAVMVPASLDAQPAYEPFVEVAARHAGSEAASLLDTYWSCGDLDWFRSISDAAGLDVVAVRTRTGTVHFPSVDAFVATEVNGTPLSERIDDRTYEMIRHGAQSVLAPWTTPTGALQAPIVGHIVTAVAETST